MSIADAYTTQTTASGQSAQAMASLQRRVAALERGGSSTVIGTGTVADATATVKGKLQLAGDLGGTASSPTVKNKLPVFDIEDYGAVGDGSLTADTGTNNTTTIQSAIDAANAAGGGIVFVPKGIFRASSLTGHSNITFMGTGHGSVIKQVAGVADNTYLISVDGATPTPANNKTGIQIVDLQLRGTCDVDAFVSSHQHVHLIHLSAVSDVLIHGCLIKGFRGDGIYLQGNSGANLRHNYRIKITETTFDGINQENRNAISIIDGEDVWIDPSCTFMNCSNPGVAPEGMPGAIDIEPNLAGSVVKDVHIGGHFKNIGGNAGVIGINPYVSLTTPMKGITIDNVTIRDSASIAFLFYGVADAVDADPRADIVVSNSKVFGATEPFEIRGLRGIRFENVTWDGCTESASIGYRYVCRDVEVNDCDFIECSTGDYPAITLYNGHRVSIDGNDFDNCGVVAGTDGVAFKLAVGLTTSVSSAVRFTRNHVHGARMLDVVEKSAGHTNTAGQNRYYGNVVNTDISPSYKGLADPYPWTGNAAPPADAAVARSEVYQYFDPATPAIHFKGRDASNILFDHVISSSGAVGFFERTVVSGAGSGATSLVASSNPVAGIGTYVAIDPFTADCEVRRITGVSGATISWNEALSYAHSASDRVIFFQGDTVPASWFGVVADGSTGGGGTDNEPALQRGLEECSRYGVNLDCAVGTMACSLPVVMPSGPGCFERFTLVPRTGYTLTGSDAKDSPFLMSRLGAKTTFTSAADDYFTTPAAHGLSAGDSVIFKGASVPAEITKGRVYYARDVTTLTFKVSATRDTSYVPGTAVNLAGTGSGDVHLKVLHLATTNIRHGMVWGRDLDIVGAAFSPDQPSYFDTFRVSRCARSLMVIGGGAQDTAFRELILEGAGSLSNVGLEIENAIIVSFDGFNAEALGKSIHVRSTAQATMFGRGGGGGTFHFYGKSHFENGGVGAGAVDIDVEGPFGPVTFDNVSTSLNAATQTFFWAHAGSGTPCMYSFRSVWFAVSGTPVAIQDDDRSTVPDTTAAMHDRRIANNVCGVSGMDWDGRHRTNATIPASDSLITAGEVLGPLFDSTAGSPAVHFRGRDIAGTVFDHTVGSGLISSVGDTNTIDHTITSGALSSAIPTTATPQVARLGVGNAAATNVLAAITAPALEANTVPIQIGTPTWDITGATAGIAPRRMSLITTSYVGGINGGRPGLTGNDIDDWRLEGDNAFGVGTFFNPFQQTHIFNSKGSLIANNVAITVDKPPPGPGGTAFHTYSEAGCYIGGTTIRSIGSQGKVFEGGVTVLQSDPARTGESSYHVDAGPAEALTAYLSLYENNPYTLYGTTFPGIGAGTTGAKGLTIHALGTRRVGTGIHLLSAATIADEAAGESAFVRAFTLTNTLGTDVFCLDGFGRLAIGDTRNQTTNLVGLGGTSGAATALTIDAANVGATVGAEIRNHSLGLRIWKRAVGTTNAAIAIGLDTTGANSAAIEDGIGFGTDITLARAGNLALNTNATFTARGFTALGTASNTSWFQFGEQTSTPATPATNYVRMYAEASGADTVVKYIDDAGTSHTLQTTSGATGTFSNLGLGQAANSYRLSFVAATNNLGGIDFGGDISLYRLSAGNLRLDQSLSVGATAAAQALVVGGIAAGGEGFLQLADQSASPSQNAATVRLYSVNTGGSTSGLRFIDGVGGTTLTPTLGMGFLEFGVDANKVRLERGANDTWHTPDDFGHGVTTATPTTSDVGVFVSSTGKLDVFTASSTDALNVWGVSGGVTLPRFRATLSSANVVNLEWSNGTTADLRITRGAASRLDVLHANGTSGAEIRFPNASSTLTFAAGGNLVTDTTNGTKIGTATGQKLGFFNAAPVTQRAAIASPTSDALGTKVAIDAIRQVLIDLGLTA